MFKKYRTMKEFKEEYYIIPKHIENIETETIKDIDIEKFHAICKLIDEWGDLIDDDILNNGYICYSDKEKKVPKEIEEQIKNDTGSIRALAKKYGYGVGTIHKIKNNKYR